MLMAKEPDLPDKIIIVKEGLEMVNELISLFTGKMQIIQWKIKVLSQGFECYIPSILDANNKLRD